MRLRTYPKDPSRIPKWAQRKKTIYPKWAPEILPIICQSCGRDLDHFDERRRFCNAKCQRKKRPCGIAGCKSRAFAGGLCQGHYREHRKRNRGVKPRLVWFKGYCEFCYRPWRSLVARRFCSVPCAKDAELEAKRYGKGGY